MTESEDPFVLPQDLAARRQDAVDRLAMLANLSIKAAGVVVDAALRGAVDETLETIAGTSNVPTALSQSRAERVLYISKHLGRVPSRTEVEVVFRTTPSAATAILTNVNAVYAATVRDLRLIRMRAGTVVFYGKHEGVDGYELVSPDRDSEEILEREIDRVQLNPFTFVLGERRVWVPRKHDGSPTLEALRIQSKPSQRQDRGK